MYSWGGLAVKLYGEKLDHTLAFGYGEKGVWHHPGPEVARLEVIQFP
jgi:hypothetical protein